MNNFNKYGEVFCLMGLLSACLAPSQCPTPEPTDIPIPTSTNTQIPVRPTPTEEPTLIPFPVNKFSLMDSSTLKLKRGKDEGPFGNKEDSYPPIKKNNIWYMKDDYGQETIINNVPINGDEVVFDISRIGGKTSRITTMVGVIISLAFLKPRNDSVYVIDFYAPSINEFVTCETPFAPPDSIYFCRPVPSIISIIIRSDGEIWGGTPDDPLWCVTCDKFVCVSTSGGTMIDEWTTPKYQLPGDPKIYYWQPGECPNFKIEPLQSE